jgi:hypothetical protein
MAVTMKNAVSGMLYHVALVRTDVLEEYFASIIRLTRIGILETLVVIAKKCYVEMSVLSRTTKHNIPEDSILVPDLP